MASVFNDSEKAGIEKTDVFRSPRTLILKDLRYALRENAEATALFCSELREPTDKSAAALAEPLIRSLDNVHCIADTISRNLRMMKDVQNTTKRFEKEAANQNENTVLTYRKTQETWRNAISQGIADLNDIRMNLKKKEQLGGTAIETQESVTILEVPNNICSKKLPEKVKEDVEGSILRRRKYSETPRTVAQPTRRSARFSRHTNTV